MSKKKLPLKRFELNLGAKFIILTSIVLAVTLSISSYLNYRSQSVYFTEFLKAKAQEHGDFIASVSIESILSNDIISMDTYVKDIAKLSDFAYGVILGKDDVPVVSAIDNQNEYVKNVINDIKSIKTEEVINRLFANENISEVYFPVLFEGEKIGTITIGIDHTRMLEYARIELMTHLIQGLLIILILSLAIYAIYRTNTLKPVQSLISGVDRVANGNLTQEVDVRSGDELGKLTIAVNWMMKKLRVSLKDTHDAMNELKDLNSTLESRVNDRTAHLELAQKIANMGYWEYAPYNDEFEVSNQVFPVFCLPDKCKITGKGIIHFIHKDDRHKVLTAFRIAVVKGTPIDIEFQIRPDCETTRYLTLSAERTSGQESSKVKLFGTIQDITDHVIAEQSTQKALIAKIEAESENEAKSSLLANMSHEIRTPLTAIIGFAETLQDKNKPQVEYDNAVNTIINSGRHLLHVINDILDLSKLESKKLEVEIIPTNLFKILRDVGSLMSLQATEKGLSFDVNYSFPLPEVIHTDPIRLKQILLNLCGNSIKFTKQGGVTINVSYLEDDSALEIHVIDSGIGIDEDKLGKLFEPFKQADSSTTRKFGGTGLGLYISKQLTEKLGGAIDVKSVKGNGSQFEFTINTGNIDPDVIVNSIDELDADYDEKSQPVLRGNLDGHILVADDNPDNQQLIKIYIDKTGANVTIANNGQEAVEKALAGEYDLILMDMQMPVMDGIEATDWLRQAGYGGKIIALTANAMKEDRERCINAGCDGFLTKPINQVLFYKTLYEIIPKAKESHQPVAREKSYELKALTKKFIEGIPERITGILNAYNSNDHEDFGRKIHQLKGIAGNFGFPEITEQAALIDVCIHENNFSNMVLLLEKLNALCLSATNGYIEDDNVASN